MRKTVIVVGVALSLATLAATSGCRRVPLAEAPDSQPSTESKSVALEGATSADIEIRMGVGELRISAEPSSTQLLQAQFTYSPETWKPEVTYRVSGARGVLVVAQPETIRDLGQRATNTWDLKLGGGVPTNVRLKLGVGESDVDLRGLDLSGLEVTTGVGEATVDLSGPRSTDFSARVQSGVGNLTLRLPRDVGVRVSGRQGGVGEMSADGFIAQGNAWVNEAWSGTGPKIDIGLTRGVGDVTLELVD